MNFVSVAHLDPFELTASLRPKMGLFRREGLGPGICPVRVPKDGEHGKWIAKQAKWVELTNYIQRIRRLADVELGRIDLLYLPPGGQAPWWEALGEYADAYEHAVVMLRTSPAFALFAGPEVWMPAIGLLTVVSRKVPRSAINMGDSPAIWLAVDFRRKMQTEEKP